MSPDRHRITFYGIAPYCLQAIFDSLVAAGYRLIWIDGQNIGRNLYYNVVFLKNTGYTWRAYWGQSSSSYQDRFNTYVPRGYRPVHVESYLYNGFIRYAVIFVKKSGPAWVAYHGVTRATHQKRFDGYVARGFRLLQRAVTEYRGIQYVVALYDKSNAGSWNARHGLNPSQYQARFNAQHRQGRRLAYFQAYTVGGSTRFADVWTTAGPGVWAFYYGMSQSGLASRINSQRQNDRYIDFISGYAYRGQPRYAAFWSR